MYSLGAEILARNCKVCSETVYRLVPTVAGGLPDKAAEAPKKLVKSEKPVILEAAPESRDNRTGDEGVRGYLLVLLVIIGVRDS